MTVDDFIRRLGDDKLMFADTLAFIEQHYSYQPSAFGIGPVSNAKDQNQGSCKVLGMALDLGLNDTQALQCFAEHYRAVLDDPNGSAHANIRALMQHGLRSVHFQQAPLERR